MTPTWKDRIILYVEHHGFIRDYSAPQSRKYLKYRQAHEGLWYYIGKAGAVHISRDGTLQSAISMTDMVRDRIARWERTPAGELARYTQGLHIERTHDATL